MAERISTMSSLDTLLKNMHIIQVTNVAPSATIDQMKELFSYLGKIKSIKIYPSDNYLIEAQSKVCYIQYSESWSVGIAQHLTNTVFIDRALIVVPIPDGIIPDEAKALALIDSNLQGFSSALSPVINEISGVDGALVITTIDPRLTALGLSQYPPLPANMDPTKIEEIRRTVCIGNLAINVTADKLLSFVNQIGEVKYVRMAGEDLQNGRSAFVEFTEQTSVANILQYNGVLFEGLPLKVTHSSNAIVKPQSKAMEMPQKDIDEAMKRVKEAQSFIAAAIEPELSTKRRSRRSRSRSRSRHRSGSRSGRRRRSRSRKRSRSRHRSSRISRSPSKRSRREKSRSRSRGKRKTISPVKKKGRSRSRSRDRRRRRRTKSRSHSRSKSISKTKSSSSKDKKSSDKKSYRSPSKEKSSKKELSVNGKPDTKREPSLEAKDTSTISETGSTVEALIDNKENFNSNEVPMDPPKTVINNDSDIEMKISDETETSNGIMQEKSIENSRDSAEEDYMAKPKSSPSPSSRSKSKSPSPKPREKSDSRSASKTRSPVTQTSRSSSRKRSTSPAKSSHRKRSESPKQSSRSSSVQRSTASAKRSSYHSPRRYRKRSATPKRYSRSPKRRSQSPRRRSRSPKRKSRSRSLVKGSRSPSRRSPGHKRASKRSSPVRRSRSPRRRSRSRSPKRDSKHHKRRKKSRERDDSRDAKKKKKSRSERESSKEMKVYRNYDEEEKGYDSGHDSKRESKDKVSIAD